MASKHYDKSFEFYDEIYKDKNYVEEVLDIKNVIVKRFKDKKIAILDMGCGTGTHLNILSKKYDNLTGVDSNADLLNIASEKVKNAKFVQGDMQTYKCDKKYDVIICLFSTIHYNKDLEELERTLRNFYNNLNYGGIIIIDFISEFVLKQKHKNKTDYGKFKCLFENCSGEKKSIYKITTFIGNEIIKEEAELGIFDNIELIKLSEDIGFNPNIIFQSERKRKFYLILEKNKITPNSETNLNSIVISLTDRCNFHCKYCFENSGAGCIEKEIDTDKVKEILKKFKKHSDISFVQFTGGEPMIRKDFFEIVKYALSLKYLVRFSTNGVMLKLLSEKNLKILSSPNVYIKISLDGSKKEIHEKYRDEGSFDKIMEGIRKLKKYSRNIGIKTVISRHNIEDIKNLLDLCYKLNLQHFTYNLLRNEGRAKRFSTIEHLDVFKKLFYILEEDKRYIKLLFSTDFVAMVLTYFISNYSIQSKHYFFVNYDGEIYPNQVMRDKSLCLGNADNFEFDLDKLKNIKLKHSKEKCKNCKLFNYCENRIFNNYYKKNKACKDFIKIIKFIEENKDSEVIKMILEEFDKMFH